MYGVSIMRKEDRFELHVRQRGGLGRHCTRQECVGPTLTSPVDAHTTTDPGHLQTGKTLGDIYRYMLERLAERQ